MLFQILTALRVSVTPLLLIMYSMQSVIMFVSFRSSRLDCVLHVGDCMSSCCPTCLARACLRSAHNKHRQCIGFQPLSVAFLEVWFMHSCIRVTWMLVKYSVSWAPPQTYWICLSAAKAQESTWDTSFLGDSYVIKSLQILEWKNTIHTWPGRLPTSLCKT